MRTHETESADSAAPPEVARVPMHVTRGCLVVSLQVDLDVAILQQLRKDLLARIEASRIDEIILDVAGLDILDARDFEELRLTLRMAEVMGARTVLVGMQAGVVSALIDLDVNIAGITATIDMDEAFMVLERGRRGAVN